MANYIANSRTNYFKVTDENEYNNIIKNLISNSEIEFMKKKIDGEIHYGFASYGWFDYKNPKTNEYNFDEFLKKIQKILPDNEVFVYMESGHEKLRYITGLAIICTNKEIRQMSLQEWILSQTKELTGRDIEDKLNY